MKISLDQIVENPNQVRDIAVDEQELEELAASIEEHGLLQPIKVRPVDNGYELVYGHRRVAAMRLLGWSHAEAIVEGVSDQDSLLQSIVENLQRQDLDILDEARSYERLVDRGHTIKEISELVNKPEGRISNRLSILRLPTPVQKLVKHHKGVHSTTTEQGGISPDSASRISSAAGTSEEAVSLARKAIDERLDSRQVRKLTGLFKETTDESVRRQIIETPWEVATEQLESEKLADSTERSTNGSKKISFNDLMHRKLVWNLQKIDVSQVDYFTIGYSGRSIEQLIELLNAADVDLLADVRRIPISRFRSEFSKSNLRDCLEHNGIEYVHWRNLGIDSEVRHSLEGEELFSWYDENVKPEEKLATYQEFLSTYRIAFMCVEVDPQSCHRHRIASTLEKKGYRLLDL